MEIKRDLAFTGFQGDDGTADPGVLRALGEGDQGALLAAVSKARLLVPVVAMLGEVEYDEKGLAHDKTSDMAVALLQGRDGRTALLAFSGVDSLSRWNPEARPMPAAAQMVATAAVQEGAAAIVLDVAGPSSGLIETDDTHHLAAGHQIIRLADGTYAWAEVGS